MTENIFLVNLTTLHKLCRWDICELFNEKDVKRSSRGLFKVQYQHDFKAEAKPQEICQNNEKKMEHRTSRMRLLTLKQRSVGGRGDSKGNVKDDEVLKLWQEVLGKTNRLISLYMTRTAKQMTPPILCCRGNVFRDLLPNNDSGINRQTHRYAHPTILLFLRVFIAAGTCLPRRCLATKGGIQFTDPLHSNDRGIYKQTHILMGGIYEVGR
jgi:hypothetical protein